MAAAVHRRAAQVPWMVLVTAVVMAGLWLRSYRLPAQSIWLDEGASIWVARRDLVTLISWLVEGDIHPPLYFLLLHWWSLLDDSVGWLRALSVLASTLTIPAAYGLARRLGGRPIGVLLALLLAMSPINVYYAQEARPYALLTMTATVSTYCLVWGLQTAKRAAWVSYTIALVCTLYTHNVGGPVVLLSHLLVLVTFALLGSGPAVAGLRASGVALLAWLPWLPALVGQTARGGASWLSGPSPQDLARMLVSFSSHGLPLAGGVVPFAPAGLEPLLVVLTVALASLALKMPRATRRGMLLALALFAIPIILAVDSTLLNPVFLDRTLLPASVPFLLLIAAGLTVLWRRPVLRPLAALSFVLVLAANALSLGQYFDHSDGQDIKEHWDHAAEYVTAHDTAGDVLAFQSNSSQLPFDYYYHRFGDQALPEVALPCHLDVCDRYEGALTDKDRERLLYQLTNYRRVWLVKREWGNWDFDLAEALGGAFADHYKLDDEKHFAGVIVQLYVRGDRRIVTNPSTLDVPGQPTSTRPRSPS